MAAEVQGNLKKNWLNLCLCRLIGIVKEKKKICLRFVCLGDLSKLKVKVYTDASYSNIGDTSASERKA